MKMKFGLRQIAVFVLLTALAGFSTGCSSEQKNDPIKSNGVALEVTSVSYTAPTIITGSLEITYTLEGNATVTDLVASVPGCTIENGSERLIDLSIYPDGKVDVNKTNPVSININLVLADGCTATTISISGTETSDEGNSWDIATTKEFQPYSGGGGSEVLPLLTIQADTPVYTIKENSGQRIVTLQVREGFNPVNGAKIKVTYPAFNSGIMNPVEYADVVDGVAKFTYTAPADISNLSPMTFTFSDANNPLSQPPAQVTFNFEQPPGQIIQTEYFITSSIDDENATMDLNKSRVISFFLKDKEGNTVADDDISSMTVTLLNTQLGDLIDSDGTVDDTTLSKTTNNVTLSVLSFNKSGLLPIEVTFVFTDVNGDPQTITKIFSLVVLSGPPTAFSMSYASTGQDENIGKFIEHIVISAVDEYGNKVNRGSAIAAGVISGYARDTTSTVGNQYSVSLTPIINYTPVGSATIANNGSGAQLTSNNLNTTTIDLANDKLATFRSDQYNYPFHASGKWDMLSHSGDTIDLLDEYSLAAENNMGYAIGHNYRQEVCSETGAKATAYVSSADGTYRLDSNGNAVIDVYYDYYLVAKTVAIYANLVTYVNGGTGDVRGGETMIHTLRGHGIEYTEMFEIPDGTDGLIIRFTGIHIIDTPRFLQNSRFIFTVKTTGDAVENSREISYTLGVGFNGAIGMYNCDYGGSTFVDVNVSDAVPGNDKGGTVTVEVKDIIVSEF